MPLVPCTCLCLSKTTRIANFLCKTAPIYTELCIVLENSTPSQYETYIRDRELRAYIFSGPTGLRACVFFTDIQHPVCTQTYMDHGLTTYNCLLGEKKSDSRNFAVDF